MTYAKTLEMPRLIVMVGLPRSGKTTWARAQGFPIVSPDAIRLALHGHRFAQLAEDFVWASAYMMVRALGLAGHSTIIVDATNVSEKRRKAWSDRFAGVEFKVIDTPPDVCRARAEAENDQEILPVIDRMAGEWDMPGYWKA